MIVVWTTGVAVRTARAGIPLSVRPLSGCSTDREDSVSTVVAVAARERAITHMVTGMIALRALETTARDALHAGPGVARRREIMGVIDHMLPRPAIARVRSAQEHEEKNARASTRTGVSVPGLSPSPPRLPRHC